jgi:hypothetical protein
MAAQQTVKRRVEEKPTKRKEGAKVQGAVRWEGRGEAIPEAVVRLFAVDRDHHEIVGEGRTGKDGRFSFTLSEQVCRDGALSFRDPYFDVLDGEGHLLLSTRETRLRAHGATWETCLTVPRARRVLVDRKQIARPEVRIGSIPVDARALDRLEPDDLIELARAVVADDVPEKALARIDALSPRLNPKRHASGSLCLTPVLEAIDEIIRRKRWPRELALEIDRIMRMRGLGFTEETHECANFIITYKTSGPAAVDPSTAAMDVLDPGCDPPVVLDTLPAGGAPTYIKLICFWLERALAAYTAPPFSLRNPAAAGKIPVDVTTTQFGGASPSGFTIGHALNPEILAAVAVHELFHMVQYEYGLPLGDPWRFTMMEGGATFAEDSSAEHMNRYLYEACSDSTWNAVDGVQLDPNLSIMSAGYNAALFLRYIAEQQSADVYDPFVGVETYRALIEQCEADGVTTAAMKTAIRALPWYQDFYEHHFLDPARLDRTSSETIFGNYALACYLKDLGTNVPDRRFDFLEDEENISFDELLSVVLPVPAAGTLVPVAIAGTGTVTPTTSVSFAGSVNTFAHQYHEVTIDAGVTNVDMQFSASPGLTSLLFQIALIDEDGNVRDIHRSDATSYTKRLTNMRDGKALTKVVLVVSGCETGGGFTISVDSVPPTPDVMITRWHSVMKHEHEVDSFSWAWTWVSPDVWVDNDADGSADSVVYFDFDNKLHVRLHNKGNDNAEGIQVELYYQDATGGLSDADWLPVQNKSGVTQVLTGLSLTAGTSDDWSVDWSPSPSGGSSHFCIRAIVTASGDPNTDNKRVLSNFGNVRVKPGYWVDLHLLRRNILPQPFPIEMQVIPRLPIGLEIAGRDLVEQRTVVLRPGEAVRDRIRINHLGRLRPEQKRLTIESHIGAPADRPIRIERRPDPRGHYEVDPRTLPPGVAGRPMVTVVHTVDGLPLGGATFLVTEEKEGEKSAK